MMCDDCFYLKEHYYTDYVDFCICSIHGYPLHVELHSKCEDFEDRIIKNLL